MTILTPNNHELHKLVRDRIEAQYPLAFIAEELCVETNELVHWLLDVYRAPRREKPLVNAKYGPAIGRSQQGGGNGWSVPEQVRRHTIASNAAKAAAEARKGSA